MTQPPAGRYGRSVSDDARKDRQLRVAGAVLGVGFVALLCWFGFSYVSEASTVSGELIKSRPVSDTEVEAHLEVRKESDVTGVCSLRALDHDRVEVGRADFTFEAGEARVDRVVSLETTRRAHAAQLVGCHPSEG
ncbi:MULTISPECIES: DUF4307 domain-containing protein [unclassified Streptomyces]|uniref:DUF4307 domain-containing protein n=1 Tax=unclassified Streptomyces TaxID=2593676 RepID=UPI0022B626D3|nr:MULTISPECIES: DUF4307 domain-containing protein [unclassified Streptomyces]MCZ7416851.1 DUF4307 domain-containing protein [Streptomyces sp. WMMC897]MCZ7433332.1 DUF4307 domain-containing protein [Streptomyces sp. WMMC1477]